jgi:hypothetical protein
MGRELEYTEMRRLALAALIHVVVPELLCSA